MERFWKSHDTSGYFFKIRKFYSSKKERKKERSNFLYLRRLDSSKRLPRVEFT